MKGNVLNKILIILPAFVIPLIYSKLTVDPVLLPKYLFFSIYLLFFLFVVFFIKPKDKKIDLSIFKSNIFKIYLSYIILTAVSLFYTINLTDGIFEWLKLFLFFSFFSVLVYYFQKDEHFIRNLCVVVSILSLIINLIGLYQFYQLISHHNVTHLSTYFIDATFANRNLFAEILLLTLPFVIYGVLKFKGAIKISSIFSLLSSLFLITSMLTRAVWLGLVVASIVTVFLFLLIRLKQKKVSVKVNFKQITILLVLIPFSILIAVFFYSRFDTGDTFKKQIGAISNVNYGGAKERIELWKKSQDIINENPIVGIGLASWKIEVLKFRVDGTKQEDAATFYQYPHNDFVMVATENGIIGLILYLLLFITILYYIIFILKHTEPSVHLFYYLMFLGVVSFCVISFFSFPKERIEQNIFLAFMFAPTVIKYHSIRLELQQNVSINQKNVFYIGIAINILLVIFSIFLGIKRLQSDTHVLKVLNAKINSNWQKVIKETNKAISPFYSMDPMSTPLEWYRGTANFNLGKNNEAVLDFEKAISINPYHIHVLNNLGTCYELKNDHKKAIEYYHKALAINPNYEDVILNLSASYFNARMIDSSYQMIRRCSVNDITERHASSLKVIVPLKFKSIKSAIAKSKIPKELLIQQKGWRYRKLKFPNANDNDFSNIYKQTVSLKIDNILADIDWMIKLHLKSVKNEISLEEQVFIDADYILNDIKE
ncbi:MAG: O-antigen ligase family protein [Flavobacteriales bacterium]|nr:O-antigen ligase family protein [Flavobacteriales bacterium]MCB9363940.1 O-antigen ligase family protein [Flavobacteriales bacterium]